MGAPKGALKPDTTMFRKKNTGQPILIDKKEGKYTFIDYIFLDHQFTILTLLSLQFIHSKLNYWMKSQKHWSLIVSDRVNVEQHSL